MSFDVYLHCLEESERLGISIAAVRSLFPILEEESGPDYWRVYYDEQNSCDIGVTAAGPDGGVLQSLHVARPCGDLMLWQALFSVLRMGFVVIYWPGGPPVVADEMVAAALPNDMTDSLGEPRVVTSAEELLQLLTES